MAFKRLKSGIDMVYLLTNDAGLLSLRSALESLDLATLAGFQYDGEASNAAASPLPCFILPSTFDKAEDVQRQRQEISVLRFCRTRSCLATHAACRCAPDALLSFARDINHSFFA